MRATGLVKHLLKLHVELFHKFLHTYIYTHNINVNLPLTVADILLFSEQVLVDMNLVVIHGPGSIEFATVIRENMQFINNKYDKCML